jgi:hypothetical protein
VRSGVERSQIHLDIAHKTSTRQLLNSNTMRDNTLGGPDFEENAFASDESGSVDSESQGQCDQTLSVDDNSLDMTDSEDTGAESFGIEFDDDDDEEDDDEDDDDADGSDSASDGITPQESMEDLDDELSENRQRHVQVIIHDPPVYSVNNNASRKMKSADSNQTTLSKSSPADVQSATQENQLEYDEKLEQSRIDETDRRNKRGIRGIPSLFGRISRTQPSRSFEADGGKAIAGQVSTESMSKKNNPHELQSDSNPDGTPLTEFIPSKSTGESQTTNPYDDPGSLIDEEGNPKARRGLFRRKTQALKDANDDDGATVSSRKSWGSRLSEGSRRSLSSLKSRLSLRRRKDETNGDLDDGSSVESHKSVWVSQAPLVLIYCLDSNLPLPLAHQPCPVTFQPEEENIRDSQ